MVVLTPHTQLSVVMVEWYNLRSVMKDLVSTSDAMMTVLALNMGGNAMEVMLTRFPLVVKCVAT